MDSLGFNTFLVAAQIHYGDTAVLDMLIREVIDISKDNAYISYARLESLDSQLPASGDNNV